MRGTGVRPVRESDLAAVAGLVRALAEYERAPSRCQPGRGQLRRALFGAEPALFGHVAQVRGDVVGCALWLLDCSGGGASPAIYVQDLFVRPEHRGRGLGRGLLAALAAESCRRGATGVEWSVQEWNLAARGFYDLLGARPFRGRTEYRLSGAALAALSHQSRTAVASD